MGTDGVFCGLGLEPEAATLRRLFLVTSPGLERSFLTKWEVFESRTIPMFNRLEMFEDLLIWKFGTRFTFHFCHVFFVYMIQIVAIKWFWDQRSSSVNSIPISSKAQVLHHPAMQWHLTAMHDLAETILIDIAKACGLREQAVLHWSCKKVSQADSLDLSTS